MPTPRSLTAEWPPPRMPGAWVDWPLLRMPAGRVGRLARRVRLEGEEVEAGRSGPGRGEGKGEAGQAGTRRAGAGRAGSGTRRGEGAEWWWRW
ncbi:hypothetical protein AB0425_30800 [Actinosynnema sp. NPDC051121]